MLGCKDFLYDMIRHKIHDLSVFLFIMYFLYNRFDYIIKIEYYNNNVHSINNVINIHILHLLLSLSYFSYAKPKSH